MEKQVKRERIQERVFFNHLTVFDTLGISSGKSPPINRKFDLVYSCHSLGCHGGRYTNK